MVFFSNCVCIFLPLANFLIFSCFTSLVAGMARSGGRLDMEESWTWLLCLFGSIFLTTHCHCAFQHLNLLLGFLFFLLLEF